jgi:hypoxanthine phosphoribosyltransferase
LFDQKSNLITLKQFNLLGEFPMVATTNNSMPVSDFQLENGSAINSKVKVYDFFASHHIGLDHKRQVIDLNGRRFDSDQYSRFKHGCVKSATVFAQTLVKDLLIFREDFFSGYAYDELSIAAFPYKELQTAAGTLTDVMIQHLNLHLHNEGKNPCTAYQVYKYTGKASNEHFYPTLGEEERKAILDQTRYEHRHGQLRSIKKLLFIDDIYVTGTSQKKVLKSLEEAGYEGEVLFAYIANVVSDTASKSPEIEFLVNHAQIKVPLDLLPMIESGNFNWNIRCLKFVLECETKEDFVAFISAAPKAVLQEMFCAALRMNYGNEVKYQTNLRILKMMVNQLCLNLLS